MIELPPHQLAELADLIADRLATRHAGELIDAAELADRIGRSREFVYEHSSALGAIRLGDGPRARLWFRWPHVLDELDRQDGRRKPRRAQPVVRPATKRRRRTAATVELLPVGSGQARRRKIGPRLGEDAE